jgi:hypothetical protein
MDERIALGWKLGPRDPARKTNPNLNRWDELPEGVRDWNRNVVKDIPTFLARAGFQVLRLVPHDGQNVNGEPVDDP